MSILGMRSSNLGVAFFYEARPSQGHFMPTPPPEITQEELEDLYATICRARENFLEAKEKCFRLFCIAKRRENYFKSKAKIQKILQKNSSAK